MSIPLDRLYTFVKHTAEKINQTAIDLRRFYPHGSKDINDLTALDPISGYQQFISPMIFCYDQEPLNFERYQDIEFSGTLEKYKALVKKYNLKKYNFQFQRHNIYDKSLLLHSEKRSTELEKYTNDGFIPVYYWSHAIISLDWFRYAQHIQQQKQSNQTFLIYNRAWSGTREYRLRLCELLINLGLQNHCKTTVNPIEPELGIHYNMHLFNNPSWRPQTVLEDFFPPSTASSNYSADFELADYESTDIEVVLETIFDDTRLQLTEKSLRPIACGQPFILAATHGSLEYLRSYGFKTFGHIWDERYDQIQDPQERLICIADLMQEIANWSPELRQKKLAQAQTVADYNRQHFFSQKFFDQVINELCNNLKSALEELENTNTSSVWIERRKKLWKIPEFQETWHDTGPESYFPGRTRHDTLKIVSKARYYYNRSRPSAGSTDV